MSNETKPKRQRHTARLKIGVSTGKLWGADDFQPIVSYRYGYLWIGNDAPKDKRCFGYVEEAVTLRIAKAIVARAERKAARKAHR